MSNHQAQEPSNYQKSQARYRRQPDNPHRLDDLHELVDFARPREAPSSSVDIIRVNPLDLASLTKEVGDSRSAYYWGPLYTLKQAPGCYFAPQAISTNLQTQLAWEAVTSYCEPPHRTNIDGVAPKPNEEENFHEAMWNVWKKEQEKQTSGVNVTTKGTDNKRKRNTAKRKYRAFQKLSWSTMGYHYDWTARSYPDETQGVQSPVPLLVQVVAKLFARTVLHLQGAAASTTSYATTACIVNYYTTKSTMGGHRDDLEVALDKPIVSWSMGRAAVFLLGGLTKEDHPVIPILIRPGDVMIMSGPSRLRFHGMARLLPPLNQLPPVDEGSIPAASQQLDQADVLGKEHHEESTTKTTPMATLSEENALALRAFLAEHRININARQVYA